MLLPLLLLGACGGEKPTAGDGSDTEVDEDVDVRDEPGEPEDLGYDAYWCRDPDDTSADSLEPCPEYFACTDNPEEGILKRCTSRDTGVPFGDGGDWSCSYQDWGGVRNSTLVCVREDGELPPDGGADASWDCHLTEGSEFEVVCFRPTNTNDFPDGGAGTDLNCRVDIVGDLVTRVCEQPDRLCPVGQVPTYRSTLDAGYGGSNVVPSDGRDPMAWTCEASNCADGQVAVVNPQLVMNPETYAMETQVLCVDAPPACAGETSPDYRFRPAWVMPDITVSEGWVCSPPCDLAVYYGGIYGGRVVCTGNPTLTCGIGETPTYVYETESWECRATCDNGMYDQRFIADVMVCIPC